MHVVTLDEHHSSPHCSKCTFGEMDLVDEAGEREIDVLRQGKCGASIGRDRSTNLRGLRWSSQQKCMAGQWDRDVNAARYMKRVFLRMLSSDKHRPHSSILARCTRSPSKGTTP